MLRCAPTFSQPLQARVAAGMAPMLWERVWVLRGVAKFRVLAKAG